MEDNHIIHLVEFLGTIFQQGPLLELQIVVVKLSFTH